MPYTFLCPQCGEVISCPPWISAYWYEHLTVSCLACGKVLTAFGGRIFDLDLVLPVGTITHTRKEHA